LTTSHGSLGYTIGGEQAEALDGNCEIDTPSARHDKLLKLLIGGTPWHSFPN
jgi:hypothetical protein